MSQPATGMLLKRMHNTIQYKKLKRKTHIAIKSFHNSKNLSRSQSFILKLLIDDAENTVLG